jgi:hypothetical protein
MVKSTVKGGALITVRTVLDYGAPVYAVPGDVYRVVSDPGPRRRLRGTRPRRRPERDAERHKLSLREEPTAF